MIQSGSTTAWVYSVSGKKNPVEEIRRILGHRTQGDRLTMLTREWVSRCYGLPGKQLGAE